MGTVDPLEHFNQYLLAEGCRKCSLGFQSNINGCCVSRGPTSSLKMIVGEAPGKDEDSTRKPFTGPAGRLLDRIWQSVGMDTKDWYLTNVVLCRPVAPRGSGKQNLTPKEEQREQCRPFLLEQIRLLNPSIIVTVGAIATAAILKVDKVRMGDHRGELRVGIYNGRAIPVFPIIHPAAILHAKHDKAKHLLYRQQMYRDIQELKKLLEERNNVQ